VGFGKGVMDLEHLTEQEKADLRERLKSLRKTAAPNNHDFRSPLRKLQILRG